MDHEGATEFTEYVDEAAYGEVIERVAHFPCGSPMVWVIRNGIRQAYCDECVEFVPVQHDDPDDDWRDAA